MISTILLYVVLPISLLLNGLSVYALLNSVRKIEKYEDTIVRFMEGATAILATARMLDEKEMFEKDDEVGILFEQLLIVIGELRVLIYGEEENEEV